MLPPPASDWSPLRPGAGALRLLARSAVVAGIGAAGLWLATHGVAGVDWSTVAAVLGQVTWSWLAVLAVVWLAGLGVYSLVLAAALPGLGMGRGLLLNLTGSAVANVLPLGGAVATAMNWRMARSWGHSNAAFAAYCLLTNVLDVLAKLLLPVLAVAGLVALSARVPVLLWTLAAAGAAVLPVAAAAWVVARRSAAVQRRLRDTAERIGHLLRRGWSRMVPASLLYVAAQVALLWCALHAVGVQPAWAVVLTAAAVERLGTLVPITPGGAGIAEAGTVAWLVTAGVAPGPAVAGVLLYRLFLVAMEVPVGGALLGGWLLRRRFHGPVPMEAAA